MMKLLSTPLVVQTKKGEYTLRLIGQADNVEVAKIIRQVMTEFSCVGDGYSIEDPEVDDMTAAYSGPRSAFFVIEQAGEIHGVGGIGPLVNGEPHVCELRKMYFLSNIRGLGLGRRLLGICLDQARMMDFSYCYLETVARMGAAGRLYLSAGFESLEGPMGNTGHNGCDNFYGMHL